MKTSQQTLAAAIMCLLFGTFSTMAQVPQLINYQGRIAVGSTNFNGTGQFKFALVSGTGTASYWSNNGSSVNGSQPTASVSIPVSLGNYSVLLGDATIANMTVVPATVFANSDVRLRIWFSDGANGFQQLTPDQRIAAVGYALIASTVPDGAITSTKLAANSVTSANIDGSTVQRRITASAPAGQFITGVNADGTVTSAAVTGADGISSPEPNLRVIRGNWNQNAVVQSGVGYSVSGSGTFSVSFDPAFSDVPTVVVCGYQIGAGGQYGFDSVASVVSATPSGCTISTTRPMSVSMIAIGPQ